MEVDALGVTVLGETEENVLKFRVLGANVTLLSIPLIDAGIAVPATVFVLLLIVVVRSRRNPLVGGRLGGSRRMVG